MQLIGPITQLHVQSSSLKQPGAKWKSYDPTPLRSVNALLLTDRGVVGLLDSGETIADVHHADFPGSKSRGENHISIGFSEHYRLMRERFPKQLQTGEAGENIIVETNRRWLPEQVQHGIVIEVTGGRLITLFDVIVAKPCVEFSRWVLEYPTDARPDRSVTEALQFLDDGMRGYYAAHGGAPVRISTGDRVYAVQPQEPPG